MRREWASQVRVSGEYGQPGGVVYRGISTKADHIFNSYANAGNWQHLTRVIMKMDPEAEIYLSPLPPFLFPLFKELIVPTTEDWQLVTISWAF